MQPFVSSCDNWNWNGANYPCVYVGGNYNRNPNYGLFYVNCNEVSNANRNIGCRLLKQNVNPPYTAQMVAHPMVKIGTFRERASTPFGALERSYC